MKLRTELHRTQAMRWPAQGRHVMAQFDAETVVVYQAYRPQIGHRVAKQGYFTGSTNEDNNGWSLNRMSWIKPNFLWMMYRCGWAEKENQEVVLAITLRRDAFDAILGAAVPSSFGQVDRYPDEASWQRAVKASDVRLQWDPDHGPGGQPLARRAVQLGLRGETLARFAREWIVSVEDITPFVIDQRAHRSTGELVTPQEDVYPCPAAIAATLGL